MTATNQLVRLTQRGITDLPDCGEYVLWGDGNAHGTAFQQQNRKISNRLNLVRRRVGAEIEVSGLSELLDVAEESGNVRS